jgi:hypothetical protein
VTVSERSYRRMFVVLALVFLLADGGEIVAGSYSSGVIAFAVAAVLGLRVAGVFPASGSLWPVKDGLGTCPRCGECELAPDVDKSGVRHCWACGADVTTAGVNEGA